MKYIIYTDGACKFNPGPGGYAFLVYLQLENCREDIKGFSGGKKLTTNNEMELMAVYKSIQFLNQYIKENKRIFPCTIYSDSAYIVNAFKEKWLDSWIKNNWKNSAKKEVKNKELWKNILSEIREFENITNGLKIEIAKVKGHSDNVFNNICDKEAVKKSLEYEKLEKD